MLYLMMVTDLGVVVHIDEVLDVPQGVIIEPAVQVHKSL